VLLNKRNIIPLEYIPNVKPSDLLKQILIENDQDKKLEQDIYSDESQMYYNSAYYLITHNLQGMLIF
jgi:hypothetical protein